MIEPRNTGRFIKEQRKRLGLTQPQLAGMLNVEPQTISKWERGLGMPDYDNLVRLRDIFGCELSELLEPPIPGAEKEDESGDADLDREQGVTNLPAIVAVFEGESSGGGRKRSFSIFDFLNRKKIGEYIRRIFGYEYENIYNQKFLFKDLRRRRSRAEYDTTLSQGMHVGSGADAVLGVEAPWLYMRVFFFLLAAFGLSLVYFSMNYSPMSSIVLGTLLAVVPLLVFLFETNFSRNISIFSLFKLVIFGGLLSLITTMLIVPLSENVVVSTVVFAPIFEEIAKAVVVVFFLSRLRPRSMLTGLLVGFAVGAGFDVFETMDYAFRSVFEGEDLLQMVAAPVGTVVARTFGSFIFGHHYLAGIFGAMYVLSKREIAFSWRDLFQWRVGATLLVCMALHAFWNGSTFFESPWASICQLIAGAVCVTATILLINIGIAQTRIMEICEVAREDADGEASENNE